MLNGLTEELRKQPVHNEIRAHRNQEDTRPARMFSLRGEENSSAERRGLGDSRLLSPKLLRGDVPSDALDNLSRLDVPPFLGERMLRNQRGQQVLLTNDRIQPEWIRRKGAQDLWPHRAKKHCRSLRVKLSLDETFDAHRYKTHTTIRSLPAPLCCCARKGSLIFLRHLR